MLGRNADVPAQRSQHHQVAQNIIAADHIEHNINASTGRFPFDCSDKILRVVIDGEIGT